jgi:hypothetical protein
MWKSTAGVGKLILTPEDLAVDERVHSACERVQNVDRQDYPHRFQYIFVVRNDKLTRFDKDLGPNYLFPVAALAFNFLALFEYSVGEVMEIMEYRRNDKPEPNSLGGTMTDENPSDLWAQWREELEEKQHQKAHRSVVGPKLRIQR